MVKRKRRAAAKQPLRFSEGRIKRGRAPGHDPSVTRARGKSTTYSSSGSMPIAAEQNRIFSERALQAHNYGGGHRPNEYVTKRPPAATLDELQHRLHELQQQRNLLRRPEMRDRVEPRRPGERAARPRSAHPAPPPAVHTNNGAVHPSRPVRRPSAPSLGGADSASPSHHAVAEVNHAADQHAAGPHYGGSPQHHHHYDRHGHPRPASARPLVGGEPTRLSGGGAAALQNRPRSSRLARGSFGAACGPPMYATSTTPRVDHYGNHDRENRHSVDEDRAARTALLRRLIREGYARLGLPAPSMTPGTPLEPLLYRQEKVLGKGAFGLVSLARSVVTGMPVAMKVVDKAKLTSENLKKTVDHEIRILKRLRHKRIVRLYEVIDTPRSIILILEYVDGGTVQQLVKKHKRLEEQDAQRILYQLIDAVEHCHTNNVCHRDLKLENFMLGRSGRALKLIDFGLSVVWKPGQALFKSYGTPCYMAPEIIKGASYSGVHVDVWSLGVALATMLTGSLPFQGAGDTELKKRILRGSFPCPEHVSAEAKDLLHKMLALAPDARITLADIRTHPWIKAYAERKDAQGGRASTADARAAGANAAEPLDDIVLGKLGELGFHADDVSRAVRANMYNHDTACYYMLLEQEQAQKSARLSERGDRGGADGGASERSSDKGGGLAAFFPFNLQ